MVLSVATKQNNNLTFSTISTDSTKMQLRIQFSRGCTGQEYRTIIVSNHSELPYVRVSYYHMSKGKVKRFQISKDSFFNALNQFELACTNQHVPYGCGGYGGGTGVLIEKHFNGQKTTFSYCQEKTGDIWNGLGYFFGLMGRELENYPFKD